MCPFLNISKCLFNFWKIFFKGTNLNNTGNNCYQREDKGLKKENVVNIKNYKSIKLIEINLNYCFYLIEENKDFILFNGEKLDNEGKEWIKLVCCSIYPIPKVKKIFINVFLLKKIGEIIYKGLIAVYPKWINREERK